MFSNPTFTAISDITAACRHYSLVAMLGWQDVRQRYRRSVLGPFWLTISMGVMIATIGMVFGKIFKTPLRDFLPFLTIGLIMWSLILSIVTEGCLGFISADGIIKQLPIPMSLHIMRLVWRNMIIFAHNFLIFPLVLLAVNRPLNLYALLCLPGLVLLIINLLWVALLLGVFCTRYRDTSPIIGSLMQVLFYLTPIVWMPSLLPERTAVYLLDYNPLFHLFQIVRAPLLGQAPTLGNWMVVLAITVVGWLSTLAIYGRYKARIAFWL